MRLRLELHPDWRSPATQRFGEELPERLQAAGEDEVLYRARNVLYRLPGPDGEVVVKWFSGRGLWKRLQRLVRPSKAPRSYRAACRLQALAIGTPAPLAWYERFAGGLVDAAYCCRFWPGEQVRSLAFRDDEARLPIIEAVGAFVASVHERGVWHRDLTPGNILFRVDTAAPSGYAFALVDCNRIAFGAVPSCARGLQNLRQLEFGDAAGDAVLRGYCQARGVDPAALQPRYERLLKKLLRFRRFKNRTRGVRYALMGKKRH